MSSKNDAAREAIIATGRKFYPTLSYSLYDKINGRTAPVRFIIDDEGEAPGWFSQRTHELHLCLGPIADSFAGAPDTPLYHDGAVDEPMLLSCMEYLLGHEAGHALYTGGTSYAWAISKTADLITEWLYRDLIGKKRFFRTKNDYVVALQQIADTAGVFVRREQLEQIGAFLANSMEDGRQERICAGESARFAKLRKVWRHAAWNADDDFSHVDASAVEKLRVAMNDVLVLATSGVHEKGFTMAFAGKPLYAEMTGYIPYITEAYIAPSTRGLAEAQFKLVEKMYPTIKDALLEASKNNAAANALAELITNMVRSGMAGTEQYGDDAHAHDDTDRSMNSAFGKSELTIVVPDDVYDELKKHAAENGESGDSGVRIVREHPLPEEQKDDDNSNGSSSGGASSDGSDGNDSGSSGAGASGSTSDGAESSDSAQGGSSASGADGADGDSADANGASAGGGASESASDDAKNGSGAGANGSDAESADEQNGSDASCDSADGESANAGASSDGGNADGAKANGSANADAGSAGTSAKSEDGSANHGSLKKIKGKGVTEKASRKDGGVAITGMSDADAKALADDIASAAAEVRADADNLISAVNAAASESRSVPTRHTAQRDVPDKAPALTKSDVSSIMHGGGFREIKHGEYDTIIPLPAELQGRGATLAKVVDRYFKEQSSPRVHNMRSGMIDGRRLTRLARNDVRVFQKKGVDKPGDTAVYILIDDSGSMCGAKTEAAFCAAAVQEEGFKAHIPLKIASFTEDGAIIHKVIKGWDEQHPWNCCYNFLMHHDGYQYGNEDNYDIRIATQELLKRPEKNRILIVLSDGTPGDVEDTRAAIDEARKRGIKVAGIYFEYGEIGMEADDFKHMYQRDYVCCTTDEIDKNLSKILKAFALHA